MKVSETILQQLGGRRFTVMTGAKNFVGGNNTLSFHIGRNAKGVNGVRITLSPMDLYDLQFLRISKRGVVVVSETSDIYYDSLPEVFTRHTGMATHL